MGKAGVRGLGAAGVTMYRSVPYSIPHAQHSRADEHFLLVFPTQIGYACVLDGSHLCFETYWST
jgi:hypothetical protein